MAITNGTTRRFQNTLGSSLKFWMVTLEDRRLHFQWGRIGTDGQPLTKEYSTQWRAEREMNLLVNQKITKGYVETTLAGVPFVAAKTFPDCAAKGIPHAWHRDTYVSAMTCIECGERREAPLPCTHVETWVRTKDGIYRCRHCGLVNATDAPISPSSGTLAADPGGFLMLGAGVAFEQIAKGASLSAKELEKLHVLKQTYSVGYYTPDPDDPPDAPRPLKKAPPKPAPTAPTLRPRRKITFED